MAAALATPLVTGHLAEVADGLTLGRLTDGVSETSKKIGEHT